ncbi:molecular chaperone HtpG [Parasphaerochaeta coccoides]|uniref:Chaperone protein HtpG n=1 Tax=Parasphaerochaeta coccoides (strain ATCC BAA-1237 / DSM 17374 / SPN1) TaxID=760011 RepID=F4GLX7_PARC1|nr:molecular chaperone HtpG [Parasphaerochaeta coccoides]AEC03018.1 Chaperone protein htpG [Parasphaerochaeta coccoides DSM 17374]
MEQKKFKTEVSQLLNLIIHSLYSNKEIFLRELISNSSDALDKLKYQSLVDDKLREISYTPRIDLSFTEGDKRTLTISDNGIGMSHDDLNDNLGTIASSGTRKFLANLTDDQKKDSNLIGQFGVGFYSSFMVADKVEVISRKAGEDQAWKWISTGKGTYTVEEAERESQGSTITLYLNEDGNEFANRWQLEQLVKKYSDHIAYPIYLAYDKTNYDNEKKDAEGNPLKTVERKVEQINAAAALWRRAKSELKEDDYNSFYKSMTYDSSDPLFYIHTQAEGTIQYTTLFFIPGKAPFDMNYADYKPGVKLYVKRVYITDDDKELLPTYLRFVRGIIDSEDLPLNVSREILQQNRVMNSIRNASVKKLLSEFSSIAEKNPDLYVKFITEYNRPLKEGLYSDYANRETLLELVRFQSSERDGFVSLASYKEHMPESQKSIYYLAGGDETSLHASPLLAAYKKKGYEVLLMTDDVDDLVISSVGTYKDLPFKAINRTGAVDDLQDEVQKEKAKEATPLVEKIKKALDGRVKDVVVSSRLTDSPAVVVTEDNAPTVRMQQMLKAMGQGDGLDVLPVLEINIDDAMLRKIDASNDDSYISDMSSVLLDQALLATGILPKDPVKFARIVHGLLSR